MENAHNSIQPRAGRELFFRIDKIEKETTVF